EVGDGPFLHPRIPRDRARETGEREHSREKPRGRPRIPQEEGLLWVTKAALLPVDNKSRTVLFNGHTKVLKGLARHVRVIALQRSRERARPARQGGNRERPVRIALRAWHSMHSGKTGSRDDL